jgi:hypothetical protein
MEHPLISRPSLCFQRSFAARTSGAMSPPGTTRQPCADIATECVATPRGPPRTSRSSCGSAPSTSEYAHFRLLCFYVSALALTLQRLPATLTLPVIQGLTLSPSFPGPASLFLLSLLLSLTSFDK